MPRKENRPQLCRENPDRGEKELGSAPLASRAIFTPSSQLEWPQPLRSDASCSGRILRVVYQNVRSLRELPQVLVILWNTRLIVRGIDYRSAGGLDAIAQASLRMIQPRATNLRPVHGPFIAAIDLVKLASRCHHVDVHRKVRAGQLRFEHLAKAVRTEIFRLKTIKVKAVLALEKTD